MNSIAVPVGCDNGAHAAVIIGGTILFVLVLTVCLYLHDNWHTKRHNKESRMTCGTQTMGLLIGTLYFPELTSADRTTLAADLRRLADDIESGMCMDIVHLVLESELRG